MVRRNFLRGFSIFGLGSLLDSYTVLAKDTQINKEREYWINLLTRITSPVLEALSQDKLKEVMPVEVFSNTQESRKKVTYLESLGRSLAGLAPWLELGADGTKEGMLRDKFIKLSAASIRKAVDPTASNYMNFIEGAQPLVDAAFLAHALIRAPKQLWGNLDHETKDNVLIALRSTRIIKPYYSNWLLFTAMIEAALLKFSKDYDAVRIDYAIKEHQAWYKGDGCTEMDLIFILIIITAMLFNLCYWML